MLAHLKAPRKNGSFHTILGVHLHSMGVKRRAINLLASLGVTISYASTLTYSNNIGKIATVSQAHHIEPGETNMTYFVYNLYRILKVD